MATYVNVEVVDGDVWLDREIAGGVEVNEALLTVRHLHYLERKACVLAYSRYWKLQGGAGGPVHVLNKHWSVVGQLT